MNTLETTRYLLPAHWVGPLIYDDYSGLSEGEECELLSWYHAAMPGYCVGVEGEPEFRPFNDADTLACDCLEFFFQEHQE